MEAFRVQGCDPIAPACRWRREPIGAQPKEVAFPHHAGRCRPEGSTFLSPVDRSCKNMKGFTIRGCYPILPRYGGTSIAPFSTNILRRIAGRYGPANESLG